MSILRGLLPEKRAAGQWGDSSIPTNGSLVPQVSGVTMSVEASMQVIAVYACVRILVDFVSTLPFRAIDRKGTGQAAVIDNQPQVLVAPWDELTMQDFLGQGVISMCLRGNQYSYITQRDRLGYAEQLMPLAPDAVSVQRDSSGNRVWRVNGTVVPEQDIFHIPNMMMPGALVGMGPIEYARSGIGLAKAAEMYGGSFYANSAHASGVIAYPGDLSPDETKSLAQSWAQAHQGLNRAHLPAVITGGATWTPISINPDDAQFLQTRAFQRAEIAMLHGIPPHMIGDVDRTTSWGTGIEQQEIGFVRLTGLGWLRRFENAFSNLLPKQIAARFDLNERLRGDTLQRYQGYTLALNGGWMNPDMVCDAEGIPRPADGSGSKYRVPLNMGDPGGTDFGPPDPTKEPK